MRKRRWRAAAAGLDVDLSVLRGKPLVFLDLAGAKVSNLTPVRELKTLKGLGLTGAKVTAAEVAELQKALPNCRIWWADSATGVEWPPPGDPATPK